MVGRQPGRGCGDAAPDQRAGESCTRSLAAADRPGWRENCRPCPPEPDPACSGLAHHKSGRPGPWPAPPRTAVNPRCLAVTSNDNGFWPFGRQVQLSRPASPRPAQRVVGRFGYADTAGRFFLQVALDTGACGMLVRPVDRGIHAHLPGDQPGGVGPESETRPGSAPTRQRAASAGTSHRQFASSHTRVGRHATANRHGPASGCRPGAGVYSTVAGGRASCRQAAAVPGSPTARRSDRLAPSPLGWALGPRCS